MRCFVLAATAVLLPSIPSFAQTPTAVATQWTTAIPMPYPETAADLRRLTVTFLQGAGSGQTPFVQQLEDARRSFWASYPSPASRALAPHFAELLLTKDLAALTSVLVSGRGTAQAIIAERQFRLIDGGIRDGSREFDVWVQFIRGQLGARRPEDLVIVNIDRLLPALANGRGAYEKYHRARDFGELDAAGRELEWVRDARTFTIMAGIRHAELSPPAAEAEYAEMVRVFGQQHVDREANRLLSAPRVKGRLVDLRPLRLALPTGTSQGDPLLDPGIAVIDADDPLTALRALVGRDDPDRFLKSTIRLYDRRTSWRDVSRMSDELTAAYGRQAILDIAATLMRAPRRASGAFEHGTPDPRPAAPFYAIVSSAARRDPKGLVRATITVGLRTDAEDRIAPEYARLVALKGEPALLEAARQVVALAHARPDMMSSAAIAAAPRAVLWGDQAYGLIVNVVTGGVSLNLEAAAVVVISALRLMGTISAGRHRNADDRPLARNVDARVRDRERGKGPVHGERRRSRIRGRVPGRRPSRSTSAPLDQ